ncbi:MAG: hypothetical protein RSA49_04995 [Anaerovoracaceae bacterium]
MYFTLSIKDLSLILLAIAGIMVLVYLAVMLKNLVQTVKKTNSILEDVEVMTDIAEKRAKELDQVFDNVSGSIKEVSEALKGQQTLIKQLSQIGSAVSSIVGMFKKDKEEQ